MAHVADVDRANRFYALLGFTCDRRYSDGDVINWSAMTSGSARLFLARADAPVVADQQAVLFYMYSNDVVGLREHLLARGVADSGAPPGEAPGTSPSTPVTGAAVFHVVPRFYMPLGELRIHDPDGYVILVGQLG